MKIVVFWQQVLVFGVVLLMLVGLSTRFSWFTHSLGYDRICLGPKTAISMFLLQNWIPSPIQHNIFSRGALTALVFKFHPDSLMMGGSWRRSGQSPRCVLVDLVTTRNTRNTRFNNRKRCASDSSNPSVTMSVAVFVDLGNESMCLSPFSSAKHQGLHVQVAKRAKHRV